MRNIFTVLVCGLAFTFAQGQIVLNSSSFPLPGIDEELANAGTVGKSDLVKSGDGQIWNFSQLGEGQKRKLVYSANSSSGVSIPGVNLVEKNELGIEVFYNADWQKGLFRLGWLVPNPLTNINTPMVLDHPMPSIDFQYPGGVLTTSVSGAIPIPKNSIPDSIKNLFPIQPDSIVLFINVAHTYEQTGSGTLITSGFTANIVPISESLKTTYTLKVLIPILGWQDVTQFIPGLSDAGNTVSTIAFWSPDFSGMMALATAIGNGETYNLEIRSNPYASNSPVVNNFNKIVDLYPNPVKDKLNLEIKEKSPVIRDITIFNLNGQIKFMDTKIPKSISLQDWSTGTYIIQLTGNDGEKYLKKFVKL